MAIQGRIGVPVPVSRVVPRRQAGVGSRILRYRQAYLFLLPTVLLLATFEYWPLINAIWRSFYNWDGTKLSVFVGLQNYVDIFSDRVFWQSVKIVFIILVFNLTLPLFGPIVVAECIYNLASPRAQYFWRTLLIVPAIVPGLVHLLLWNYFYNPIDGLFNVILQHFGMGAQAWLGDAREALPSLLAIGLPWSGGIWMLVFLAGLQNIPGEVIDASVVDGCTRWRRVFAIDLPLIRGQIKLTAILTVIGTLQNFVNVLILTNGGPAFATYVPGLYLYQQAFANQRMGYASAVGVVIFVVIMGVTYLNVRYVRGANE